MELCPSQDTRGDSTSQRSSCSVLRLSTRMDSSIKVSSLVIAAGGKCHSYEWRTGVWSNNRRPVWCQRSDGINVTGKELLAFVCLKKDVLHLYLTEQTEQN